MENRDSRCVDRQGGTTADCRSAAAVYVGVLLASPPKQHARQRCMAGGQPRRSITTAAQASRLLRPWAENARGVMRLSFPASVTASESARGDRRLHEALLPVPSPARCTSSTSPVGGRRGRRERRGRRGRSVSWPASACASRQRTLGVAPVSGRCAPAPPPSPPRSKRGHTGSDRNSSAGGDRLSCAPAYPPPWPDGWTSPGKASAPARGYCHAGHTNDIDFVCPESRRKPDRAGRDPTGAPPAAHHWPPAVAAAPHGAVPQWIEEADPPVEEGGVSRRRTAAPHEDKGRPRGDAVVTRLFGVLPLAPPPVGEPAAPTRLDHCGNEGESSKRGWRQKPPFQSALGPGGESALQRPNRCNELPWTLHPEGHQCLAKLAKSLGGAEAAARGKKEVHHPTWMDG